MEKPSIKINSFTWNSATKNLDEVVREVEFLITEDGLVCCDPYAVDYYRDMIDEELEKWASDQGGYWEWLNPEAVYFCK